MTSPPNPIRQAASGLDLSGRLGYTTTVVGSPAAATETIVGSISLTQNPTVTFGVVLAAAVALTVGTSGTGVTLKIRQTDTSGTTLYSTGILNATAAQLISRGGLALDVSPTLPGQVYVVTLTVANGAATSTVSAVQFAAFVV